MKTILAAAVLMVAGAAMAFPPSPPAAKVVGSSIVVSWDQSQYGTTSEVQLWYADGGVRTTPIRQISGASGGSATFSALLPSGYYVVVLSEQNRAGFTSEPVNVP